MIWSFKGDVKKENAWRCYHTGCWEMVSPAKSTIAYTTARATSFSLCSYSFEFQDRPLLPTDRYIVGKLDSIDGLDGKPLKFAYGEALRFVFLTKEKDCEGRKVSTIVSATSCSPGSRLFRTLLDLGVTPAKGQEIDGLLKNVIGQSFELLCGPPNTKGFQNVVSIRPIYNKFPAGKKD